MKLSHHRVRPGSLGDIFRNGNKAVVLEDDRRAARLWDMLVEFSPNQSPAADDEILPWEASLTDMARNHRPGSGVGEHSGDVLFLIPGVLMYTARKISVFSETKTQTLHTFPEMFCNGNRQFTLPEKTRKAVWKFGTEILRSILPANTELPPYCVTIERLKYHNCMEDIDQSYTLLYNSGGRWSKIGRKLDYYSASAVGFFDTKISRDLFALLRLFPYSGSLFSKLNELLRPFSKMKDVPEHLHIIGKPHTDGRFFTCLWSNRDVVRTELYDGRLWVELPLNPTSPLILPGRHLQAEYDIEPTWHRVLHNTQSRQSTSSRPNITLVIGVEPLSKRFAAHNM